MDFDKATLYDWSGANVWLFQHINGIKGAWYESAMIFLSRSADHHNFLYVMALCVICGFLEYMLRKLAKKGGTSHCLTAWFGVLCVLGASYASDGLMVKTLKSHFEYPRPYVALGPETVTVLDDRKEMGDDYHSFPSGHASFITVVVVSLWPVLSATLKKIAPFFIFGVCWSRIAEGMHFPADVLAGFISAFLVTLLVRFILYNIFRKLHLKC